MLHDKPFKRSQRTTSRENEASIDDGTGPVIDAISMAGPKMAMVRYDRNRLRSCPHCGSGSIYRWGKSETGVPRGRCRDCERTFSPRTGTWIAGVREAEKFARVLDDMLTKAPGSCRRLAAVLEVDKMTIWHWRRKISQALLGPEPALVSAPVEVDDRPIRESRKGSREWVDYHRDPSRHPAPNRPRWVDIDRHCLPLPRALAAYQLRVLITVAEGRCRPIVAPLVCPSAARHFCDACKTGTQYGGAGRYRRLTSGLIGRQAELAMIGSAMDQPTTAALPAARDRWRVDRSAPKLCVAPSRAKLGARNHANRVGKAAPAPSSQGTDNAVLRNLQQPTMDCLAAAFRAFIRPFAGPAGKYLEAYAAWFIKRLEGSDEGRLDRAWTLLVA